MERILRAWPSRMLMREFFTTFVPKPDVTCTFNLENNDIICPTGQITRISSVAGKLYLHFLFFKKTQYLNTDTYWKENFYQIPRDFDFLQGGIVEINTNHIKIRNEETWYRKQVSWPGRQLALTCLCRICRGMGIDTLSPLPSVMRPRDVSLVDPSELKWQMGVK